MAGELVIPCVACSKVLSRIESVNEVRLKFDVYRCTDAACARRAVVIYEPEGGLTEPEQTVVEREIARHGAFFPSDDQQRFGGGFGRF